MTHEEEMKALRAETAKLRADNDKMQKQIEQQLQQMNDDINTMINNMKG